MAEPNPSHPERDGAPDPVPICPWEPDLTREEIDRRVRESKRSSLDDILKRLGEPICPWEPDLTAEEIERRIQEPGGSTLAEFWRKIGVERPDQREGEIPTEPRPPGNRAHAPINPTGLGLRGRRRSPESLVLPPF